MKVVPVGENSSYPNIAPGLIVSQNPMPGTLIESKDPNEKPEIHVVSEQATVIILMHEWAVPAQPRRTTMVAHHVCLFNISHACAYQ